jgi:hypothetical protein
MNFKFRYKEVNAWAYAWIQRGYALIERGKQGLDHLGKRNNILIIREGWRNQIL